MVGREATLMRMRGATGLPGDGGRKAHGAIRRMALGLELSVEIEPTRMSEAGSLDHLIT
jgi:hypothetical protein